MHCIKCGKNISDDSRFCEFCGNEIKIKEQPVTKTVSDSQQSGSSFGNIKRQEAKQEITVGIIWAGIGAAITWISYTMASDGDTYFIFWGLIIYGGYKIIKGIYHLSD